MRRYPAQMLFNTWLISTVLCPSAALAQVEIIRGIDRMNKAVNAREARQERAREAQLREQERRREQEAAVGRQLGNAGAFPRTRDSHEAALSNNPWARAARKEAGEMPPIELFVAADCADCARMERYLNEVDVPYRVYNLQPGSEAEQVYLAQIGRGVIPVVRVGSSIVRGYQPEEVRHAILRERPPQWSK